MTVTKLEPLNQKRTKVYIDEVYAFVLYRAEIRKFSIEEGKEIPQEVHDEIVTDLLPKRAKLRAMNLLTSRPYTEQQMTK